MIKKSTRGGLPAKSVSLLLPTILPALAYALPGNCTTCHSTQSQQHAQSVHTHLSCHECHGGENQYEITADSASFKHFDHGSKFLGHVERAAVPQLCGDCHADVARMNPYGLRTDQLAAYWTSGHGRTLKEKGDSRVAVCIDCHGSHAVVKSSEPTSKTNPFNVPDTCGHCHADSKLMAEFKLPVQIVGEYRQSVHGDLLLNGRDSGAPNCATCHGNHAATPPGFASVGSVCGQCHQHASEHFQKSIHATQEQFHGCVQCHGGGPDAHFHHIEKITKPAGVLIERYAHLLKTDAKPTSQQVVEALHPDPKQIMLKALPSCLECHESIDEDASLQKFFHLIDTISDAEHRYVTTANYLEQLARGVVLVDNERFKFEEATTHLIALAPLQHTLDNEIVAAKVTELNTVADSVHADLVGLEKGLLLRKQALLPIWGFALVFSLLLYVKYKSLRARYVAPLPRGNG
jgi:hypothetical protein